MLGHPLIDGGLSRRDDERRVNRRRLVGASLAGLALAVTGPGHPARAAGSMVDVPTYSQQRNLSCEYAAAVIAMAAYGTWVSEWAFDELVGWSANPHWGYRGDINGQWGNTTDYGVYAEPLAAALPTFGFAGEVHYAQGDAAGLTTHLDLGQPVIVWLGYWGDQGFYEYAADGSPYKLTPGYHVVVAYGYDDWNVYVSDPALGTYSSWGWGDFMWMWSVLDGMALAVFPT